MGGVVLFLREGGLFGENLPQGGAGGWRCAQGSSGLVGSAHRGAPGARAGSEELAGCPPSWAGEEGYMTGSQWRRPFGPGAQPPVSPELRGYDNALLLNACRALTLPGSFLSSPHRVSPQFQEAGLREARHLPNAHLFAPWSEGEGDLNSSLSGSNISGLTGETGPPPPGVEESPYFPTRGWGDLAAPSHSRRYFRPGHAALGAALVTGRKPSGAAGLGEGGAAASRVSSARV